MSLTKHLLTITPQSLHRATTHSFLQHAGQGTLSKKHLTRWLTQDRLYAQSYIRFIGLLLSKIDLSSSPSSFSTTSTTDRAVGILSDALVNIRCELGFFAAVAEEYDLKLDSLSEDNENRDEKEKDVSVAQPGTDTNPNPASHTQTDKSGKNNDTDNTDNDQGYITHAYINLFMSAGSAGVSLLEGLVVLWATEMCYLRAWRYAASFLTEKERQREEEDADGGALRNRFIPNWTNPEFERFVEEIGDLVDAMADEQGEENGEMRARCERWWKQVLWLEERFWPTI
ncbi:hypothetical protein EYZ11_004425 [Aspergillus tanneri]|uniref:Thiaminase-2/PQQC domain-containing protein n=1 Tax=Aspergillus tanneri TaxID=1220188 RepID=A0A4S3JKX0_9EURO|nr:uncharacterized protein ATNIH1004_007729 [Aspergillus tanneri]KAA8646302.1 hypothetical protein ATNIH1004_007729 [Aspergillus tanneri]THC96103.1 hypothetical protein EYZ11_004425 [Aspergillus tanneri]